MIDPKEFRIGNWVNNTFTDLGPMQITGMRLYLLEDAIQRNDSDFEKWITIPLTPEILDKCGFKKAVSFYMKISDSKQIEIAHNDLQEWYVYFRNMTHGSVDDDYVCLMRNLKHLHQLQNLYYSLTGKELICNHEK